MHTWCLRECGTVSFGILFRCLALLPILSFLSRSVSVRHWTNYHVTPFSLSILEVVQVLQLTTATETEPGQKTGSRSGLRRMLADRRLGPNDKMNTFALPRWSSTTFIINWSKV